MTSIRKYKKWWKSFMVKGWHDVRFPKRLETIRQSNRFRIYIWHSRDTSMKQKKQSLVPCFFRIIRQRSFYHPKSRHRSSPGACHGVP